jgi:hypothetical protein
MGARSAVGSLTITLERIDVTVAEDRETAQVTLSLIARMAITPG